jgi:hypothetical protein
LGLLDEAQEIPFTFMETFLYRLNGILWELFVLNNKIVKIVPKVICTSCSTVAVKDSKKTDLRPFDIEIGLVFGFQNVQYDGDPVFIIVSDDTLIGVGGI